MIDFIPFPKVPRLSREVIVTEKIDGTNAGLQIAALAAGDDVGDNWTAILNGFVIYAQSRNRIITPTADNYGFAAWVLANAEDLLALGVGAHFGEWWGNGIQRGYGLKEKRFSLFNASRWVDASPGPCHVVPVLYQGIFDEARINGALVDLLVTGSVAATGFANPEGVMIYHTAAGHYFKKTALGVDGAKNV